MPLFNINNIIILNQKIKDPLLKLSMKVIEIVIESNLIEFYYLSTFLKTFLKFN